MHRMGSLLRRALWGASACVLLLAAPANANQLVVTADFDGDGHGDHVTIAGREPTVLRIWLSATKTTEFVRSPEPVLHVAAADLDGDRRAELIASNRSWFLQIWTKPQKRFRTYRSRLAPRPVGFSAARDRALAARPAGSLLTTCTPRPLEASLATNAQLVALVTTDWHHAPRARDEAPSPVSFTLLAPRPPPLPTA